jgi:hypothetical protein
VSLSFRQDAAEPGCDPGIDSGRSGAHERSTMSNEQVAPEMKDLAVICWPRLRGWSRTETRSTGSRTGAVAALEISVDAIRHEQASGGRTRRTPVLGRAAGPGYSVAA